ncbi:MAG: PAS domain S-box protein, partial [Giesbergeria sp.]|nr:PAS domain S-box protein [Giesbergeria sp.]
ALFEHQRDGVMILNPDGSVFEANPQCAALLGYPMEELRHLRVSDWDIRSPQDITARRLESVGAGGRIIETLLRRKDGSVFACEVALSRAQWSGKTFILTLLRDISDRKRVESELDTYRQDLEALVEQRTRELNERSEQLDTIFTLSPDGFVSFDQERRITFANPSFLRLTGLQASEIIGLDEKAFATRLNRQCGDRNRFPDIAVLRQARQQAAGSGTADRSRRHLFELVTPAHRVLVVRIRLSEVATVSQILYFRDVTHETEVDRMKSEFLSTAAHELRTPMASIYGYTELLRLREFSAEKRGEILATVSRQAERMSDIINELLDLARIEARRGAAKTSTSSALPCRTSWPTPSPATSPRKAGTARSCPRPCPPSS